MAHVSTSYGALLPLPLYDIYHPHSLAQHTCIPVIACIRSDRLSSALLLFVNQMLPEDGIDTLVTITREIGVEKEFLRAAMKL